MQWKRQNKKLRSGLGSAHCSAAGGNQPPDQTEAQTRAVAVLLIGEGSAVIVHADDDLVAPDPRRELDESTALVEESMLERIGGQFVHGERHGRDMKQPPPP